MITRSQTSGAKRNAVKTYQADCCVHEDGARGKRRRLQIRCEACSEGIDRRNSIATHMPQGIPSSKTKESILQQRKKGARYSSQNDGTVPKRQRIQTLEIGNEKTANFSFAGRRMRDDPLIATLACRDVDNETTWGRPTEDRIQETVSTSESRCKGYILALPAVKSGSSSQKARKLDRKRTRHRTNENGLASTQVHFLERPAFKRRLSTQDNCVENHHGYIHKNNIINVEDHTEDCHRIVDTNSIAMSELTNTQSQVEKLNQTEETSIFTQNKANMHLTSSHSNKEGILFGSDSFHDHGQGTDAMEPDNTSLHSLSAQRDKQRKRVRKSTSLSMQRKLKQSNHKGTRLPSMQGKSKRSSDKGIMAAKLRWKQLILRINAVTAGLSSACTDDRVQDSESGVAHRQDILFEEGQTMHAENSQSCITKPLHHRRKRLSGHGRSKGPRQKQVHRQQQRICKEQQSLLRWMKTWLTQANFSQCPNDQSTNTLTEAFIITEDERNSFAQTMVKACQQNPNLRTLFFESVRSLTLNGFMHDAASTLLQEESCEQVQTVLDAWQEFKGHNITTGSLPVNVFKAVNQLHEVAGDLSTKFNCLDGGFGFEQLDGKTWKLNLPTIPKPNPTVTNTAEKDITA